MHAITLQSYRGMQALHSMIYPVEASDDLAERHREFHVTRSVLFVFEHRRMSRYWIFWNLEFDISRYTSSSINQLL